MPHTSTQVRPGEKSQVNLFGVYVAPMSVIMALAFAAR
jgi:hypothetical protein